MARGTDTELAEHLKKGHVELAVAGPLGEEWERLDTWPLFHEPLLLAARTGHALAGRNAVAAERLAREAILVNPACASAAALAGLLQARGIVWGGGHQVGSQADLVSLIEAGLGLGFLPQSALRGGELRAVPIEGLDLARQVVLYGVAGRQRSPAADAFLKLARSRDWSGEAHPRPATRSTRRSP